MTALDGDLLQGPLPQGRGQGDRDVAEGPTLPDLRTDIVPIRRTQ